MYTFFTHRNPGRAKIDSVVPNTSASLSGTLGSNGWFVSSPVSITLTATDATSGMAETYYIVDGGAQQIYTSSFVVSGDGTHRITFWSVDNAGNAETSKTLSVGIDSKAPHTIDSLSGTMGTNNWFVSSSVGVALTATDGTSGGAVTYYTVDGGNTQTYTAPFHVPGEGSHKITFWSMDKADDVEAPAGTDNFKIDSSAPTSSANALPAITHTTSFTVNWAGSDPAKGSGLACFDIYISDNGGPFTLWQSAVTETSANFLGVDGHTYGFYSVATDNAGNVQAMPAAAQAATLLVIVGPVSLSQSTIVADAATVSGWQYDPGDNDRSRRQGQPGTEWRLGCPFWPVGQRQGHF